MTTRLVSVLGLCLALGGLFSAGCYSTGDLGSQPYYCSPELPDCPDNYQCDLTNSSGLCKNTAKCVCLKTCATNDDCNFTDVLQGNGTCIAASSLCKPQNCRTAADCGGGVCGRTTLTCGGE